MCSSDRYRHRKACRLFFIGIVACVGVVFALLWVNDPLQVFHPSFFHRDRLSPFMREQAAAIIRLYDFDGCILGSSVLENTSADEASRKLGGRFVNLSMSGSDLYERAFVLRKLLKKGMAHVICSLDDMVLQCRMGFPPYPPELWAFLYDDTPWNDIKVYLNKKFIVAVVNPYFSTKRITLDRPNAWFDREASRCLFGGLENWVRHWDIEFLRDFLTKTLPQAAAHSNASARTVPDQAEVRKAEAYLDTYLIDIAAKYKNTEFYLIFPPYHKFRFADMMQNNPEIFFMHQHVIRYVVKKAALYKNIHIYGYENESFTYDISRYCNVGHYDEKINSMFIDAIAKQTNELTLDNIEKYLDECKNQAAAYDINMLNNEAQQLIRKYHSNTIQ